MKDPSLSLLSRGCGQLVKTEMDSDEGKVEVYFEPEDYFNWRSHHAFFHLSRISAGRGLEPVPPKTYSTRKGPLILYSEDLALSSWHSGGLDRKRRATRHYRQEVELQLRTLRDLTGAILAYGNKQEGPGKGQPFLRFLTDPQEEQAERQVRPGYSAKRYLAHLSHTWHPHGQPLSSTDLLSGVPGDPSVPHDDPQTPSLYHENQLDLSTPPRPYKVPLGVLPAIPEGEKSWICSGGPPETENTNPLSKEQSHETEDVVWKRAGRRRRTEFRFMTESLRAGLSPVPETEHLSLGEDTRNTEEPKEALGRAFEGKQNEMPKEAHSSMKTASIDSSWLHSEKSHVTYYGGTLAGGRRNPTSKSSRVEQKGLDPWGLSEELHFPPIPSGMCFGLGPVKETDTSEKPDGEGVEMVKLPPIHGPERTQMCFRKKRPGTDVPKELLVLPLLYPGSTEQEGELESKKTDVSHHEDAGKMRDDLSRSPRQEVEERCESPSADKMPRALPVLRPREIDLDWFGQRLEPDKTEPDVGHHQEDCFSSGILPPIIGRKGPGNQRPMASFRVHSKDPHEPQTGIIRGSIPEVLRESYEGNSVGSLIMGPDGEILRLSLLDPLGKGGEELVLDDITRKEALRSLSSDVIMGQAWTVFLQPGGEMSREGESAENVTNLVHNGAAYQNQSNMNETGKVGGEGLEKTGERTGHVAPDKDLFLESWGENESGQWAAGKETIKGPLRGQRHGEDGGSESKRGPLLSAPQGESGGSSHGNNGPARPLESGVLVGHPPPPHSTGKGQSASGVPYSHAQLEGSATAGLEALRGRAEQKNEEETSKGARLNGEKATGECEEGPTKEEEEEEEHLLSALSKQAANLSTGKTVSSFQKGGKGKGGREKPKKDTESKSGASLNKKKVKVQERQGRAEFVVGKPRESHANKKTENADAILKTKTRATVPEITVEADPECCAENGVEDGGRDVKDDKDELSSQSSDTHRDSVEEGTVSERDSSILRRCEDATSSRAGVTSSLSLPPGAATASKDFVSLDGSEINSYASTGQSSGRREQHRAEQAERRRQDVERKRRERDEERRRQQEREEREERMRRELEEEQEARIQEIRLRKQREEEERAQEEAEEQSRRRREQAEKERERRRQEEHRHRLQQLHQRRLEEEALKAAEAQRREQEEEERRVEEWRRLQEMEEGERMECLRRRREEEESRRRLEEERRRLNEEQTLRALEEARQQAQLFSRQRDLLEQQLRFRRGLLLEAGGLERLQDVSRPWVYSYFQLLEMLGLQGAPEELPEEA
ncbi:uncharacterized protein KIAA2012 homolog isoform X2 [Amia ocellicauda]|uniref:uncharacterized protein KIAA2012 homolog isoform X2 n=1 Tax=Amia ocellicauda TaxID=2972642 RepID=UPI003464D99C